MANEEHLARLNEGVEAWNQWRARHPDIKPDLRRVGLNEKHLSGANLSQADLTESYLIRADLSQANLIKANFFLARLNMANLLQARLTRASFHAAFLYGANLSRTMLFGADFESANLERANLCCADLRRALFHHAHLVETNFKNANLTGCRVYGVSTWNVNLEGAQQSDLVITPYHEPRITVDNLEVAQFIYLLLHNEKIREVIDTITSKAVLILGRFNPPERKAVLDTIREEVRKQKLLPILFDFTPSASQTTLETVSTLAHMARFVIADLTDAKSVLQELQAIVPNNPSVPVQPILLASQEEPGMFDFIRRFPWVLETYRYHSLGEVLAALEEIIARADKARAR
jgi:Pentapeptide repeats (8 copies)